MTVQGAIEEIVKETCQCCETPTECKWCEYKIAIECMEEVEQYRALGTVEQLEWCKDASHWKNLYKDKLEQYESLGTVEELKEAMELFEKTKIVGAENIIIIRKDGTYEVDGIDILDAYEKQIPKKPTHIHEEYEKHQWKKKKNGEVDDWAWGSGYCNGVVCERCGETICVHCNPNYDDEPCIVDKDLCPNCGKQVWSCEHKNYCSECGQALKWGEEDD